MKRRRQHSRHHLSRDAERLAWLAAGLADSGSRVEDAYWEGELAALIDKLLRAAEDEVFNQALDRLYESHTRAYDELADLVEAGAETGRFQAGGESPETGAGGAWTGLLIALPVLAWSRYAVPAKGLSGGVMQGLRAQLSAHVMAGGARLALADCLYSPDQLPRGYAETRRLADGLWQAALADRDLHVEAKKLPETAVYVSDVRYILGAVVVPAGHPLFRWNEPDGSRAEALARWREQAGPNLGAALAGCAYELLLPDAYFAAWRQADREIRPYSLKAAVAYMQALFNRPAGLMRAVVAPFYDGWLAEYRVGFTLANSDDVVHGVVWPLLGSDEEGGEMAGEIERLLKEAGVGEVLVQGQRYPLEYCDDCGAPLYPSPEGESVHAELPEDMESPPAHLH